MGRTLSIALLAALLSTAAIAQSGTSGGGASVGGAAGGAPGSQPSGTAGVSPSTSNPSVGTPGTPGPSSGAGLPGGTGPGSTVVVPVQPPPPISGAIGSPREQSNVGTSLPQTNTNVGPRSNTGQGSSRVANAQVINEFNPGAVTDRGLDAAVNDIAAMRSHELRSLTRVLDVCTANEHPKERVGKCGAVRRSYKSEFDQGRPIDLSLAELDRVVRFQHMFRTSGVPNTEYEDRINDRLRKSARLALATNELREQLAVDSRQPDLTKDVKMAP